MKTTKGKQTTDKKESTEKMRYFSMFTGIGGFELGIKQAYENLHNSEGEQQRGIPQYQSDARESFVGVEQPTCIGFSEIDKYASQLLSIKWPNVKNYGDATKINETELPDFDLLVGGFPCQSFSIAGKRKGFDDTRGTLFFEIARILTYKKPRNVLLENVKGLLSHDGGRTFQTIIGVLAELGYFVEWQVLNSKNFGVPQNRERVFIVGHLGGVPKRKVFPITKNDSEDIVLPTITTRITADSNGTYVSERQAHKIDQINQPKHSNDRVYGEEGISPTLNTMQGGMRQPKVLTGSPVYMDGKRGMNYQTTNTVPTIRATQYKSGDNQSKIIDGVKIRRLTPLECERLQGFPDNWTKDFSDTQRYKMCGNAVTVNVVQYVISRLFL